MLAQDFLIVVRTVLAAAICMTDTTLWRTPQGDGHVQRTDRQVTFHAVSDRPADHAPRMQIEDDCEKEPALSRPDLADVTRSFLVGAICREVLVQQVRCDVEAVVAARGRLELLVPPDLYPVFFH